MKKLKETDHAIVQFEEETKTLELIWKKTVTKEIYREVFLEALDLLIKNNSKNFISDIRKEGVVGPDNTKWLQENIIPKALKSGLQKIAIVMDEDIFKEFYTENIKKAIEGNAQINLFKSMEEAYKWIKNE
jgi:hypothetical protein